MLRHWVFTVQPGKRQEATAWLKEMGKCFLTLWPQHNPRVYATAVGNAQQLHMTVELDDYATIDSAHADIGADQDFMQLWAKKDGLFSEECAEIWSGLR